MIAGIGTDIVEICRIEKALERSEKFMQKVFSSHEQEYLKSRKMRPEYVAGRFAAKEAVSKAMGTGFVGFGFTDVEIVRAASGKPEVVLKEKADKVARGFGEYKIHLSITHGRDCAVAFAVLEVL
ncbi:MAG: holo-ACP synthase [Firmicutes bacterium]|nr:holo-ACP synthase [Bacillota bacterium]